MATGLLYGTECVAETHVNDEALLTAWADGDTNAGDALFGRHIHRLSRFFRAKGFSESDDLIQSTFVGCLESVRRLGGDVTFSALMFQIARRRAIDELRARYAKHRNFEPLETSVLDLAPTASSVMARTARRARLHQAMRSLPLDLQITLELAYWEGLKAREIAEVFEIPEGTVRSRLRLAKARLKETIQGEKNLRSV